MGRFAGMTALDRLEAAGLFKDFEHAVKAGARKSAVEMLMSVEIGEEQAIVIYEGAARLKRSLGA